MTIDRQLLDFAHEIGHLHLLPHVGNGDDRGWTIKVLGVDGRGLLDRCYYGDTIEECLAKAWKGEGYQMEDESEDESN